MVYHTIQNFGMMHKNLVDNLLATAFVMLHSLFSWLIIGQEYFLAHQHWFAKFATIFYHTVDDVMFICYAN